MRIDDAPDASRAALTCWNELPSRPNQCRVDLGEGADVVYPDEPVTLESGDALTVVARLPKTADCPANYKYAAFATDNRLSNSAI